MRGSEIRGVLAFTPYKICIFLIYMTKLRICLPRSNSGKTFWIRTCATTVESNGLALQQTTNKERERESKKLKLSNLLTQNICCNFTRQVSTLQHITNMQTSIYTENLHHKLVLVTLFLVYLIHQHKKIEISWKIATRIPFFHILHSLYTCVHPSIYQWKRSPVGVQSL